MLWRDSLWSPAPISRAPLASAACTHSLQLDPLSSSPLSSESCEISYDMLPEVGPVAHKEYRDVRLTMRCLARGTSCKAQGTLAGPACFSCWIGMHTAQISGLWVREHWAPGPWALHGVKLVDLRMLGPPQRRLEGVKRGWFWRVSRVSTV